MADEGVPLIYEHPRRVWVEDGHVYVDGHDGRTLQMTPEVAISMGRLLDRFGSDALIHKILEEGPARK